MDAAFAAFVIYSNPSTFVSKDATNVRRDFVKYPLANGVAGISSIKAKVSKELIPQGKGVYSVLLRTEEFRNFIEFRSIIIQVSTAWKDYKTIVDIYDNSLGVDVGGTFNGFEKLNMHAVRAGNIVKLSGSANIRSVLTIEYKFIITVPEDKNQLCLISMRSSIRGKYGGFVNVTNLPPTPALQMTKKCPIIRIFSSTDALLGENVAQTIFVSSEGTWDRTPRVTSVLAPTHLCTFISKCLYHNVDYRALVVYSCTRYFLWFLITSKWTERVLLQCNTDKFFYALSQSKYACWKEFFEQREVAGFDKLFLYK